MGKELQGRRARVSECRGRGVALGWGKEVGGRRRQRGNVESRKRELFLLLSPCRGREEEVTGDVAECLGPTWR